MTKTVWIIGASAGIGRALAQKLAKQGYNIALSARNEESLKEAASELDKGAKSWVSPCDASDVKSLKASYKDLTKKAGRLDIIVFAAGIYDPMPLGSYDHKKSIQTLDVNLGGAFNVFEAVREQALDASTPLHLAWVASVAGYRGLPGSCAYGASKAALINFAEIQKAELEKHNTKVQVINPGFVKTRLTEKNNFEMPMQITVEEAAESIAKGLESSKFEILFPSVFGFIMKMLRVMPYWLYFKLSKQLVQDNKEDKR